jgi:2'-5' RNA ligase
VTDRWYWGVVVRVDEADAMLDALAARAVRCPGIHVQRPGSAHITLLYAPLRGLEAADDLARRARTAAADAEPFDLTLHGAGEFPTPSRIVAWLAAENGIAELRRLRRALCDCDDDVLPHPWIPHCTALYAEAPTAYEPFRGDVRKILDDTRVSVRVDALWVAGFPASGHAAHDLEYRLRVPLG